MTARSICPDFSELEIPMDAWSEPFWQAGSEGRVIMPRCTSCGTFRWPAGPLAATVPEAASIMMVLYLW